MRNKEKLHEWIDRYNNKDLSGEELETFLEMMNKDFRVREEVLLDRDLTSVLKQYDILELRKKIRKIYSEDPGKRTRNIRIVLLAASLLILLSTEYTIFYLTRLQKKTNQPEFVRLQNIHREKNPDLVWTGWQVTKPYPAKFLQGNLISLNQDSGEMQNSKDLLAYYQVNTTLDHLVGVTQRSGSFTMIEPTLPASFTSKSTIWFSWRTENPVETSLIVENNRGLAIYESDSNNIPTVQINASFLGKGLFYYKIMRKDEVIYFGKFTVQ